MQLPHAVVADGNSCLLGTLDNLQPSGDVTTIRRIRLDVRKPGFGKREFELVNGLKVLAMASDMPAISTAVIRDRRLFEPEQSKGSNARAAVIACSTVRE